MQLLAAGGSTVRPHAPPPCSNVGRTRRPPPAARPRRCGSRGGGRGAAQARMFPRDADFATAQLRGIVEELRADEALAPLLDDAAVAAAVKEIAADPLAVSKHASNPKVMRVLERLLGQGLPAAEAAAFAEAGTTPAAMLAGMSSDAELQQLLSEPAVRGALAAIRRSPAAGMARWGSDPRVSRALDLLEAVLGEAQQAGGASGSLGVLVDTVAEEVKQQQQRQQRQ